MTAVDASILTRLGMSERAKAVPVAADAFVVPAPALRYISRRIESYLGAGAM